MPSTERSRRRCRRSPSTPPTECLRRIPTPPWLRRSRCPPPSRSTPPTPPTAEDEEGYDIDYDVYYDTAAAENYDDGYDPQAYQQFQSTLAPYGDWVNDPTYGEVWSPSPGVVGDDFSPYGSDGDWSLTDYGWTWVSNYDWGWAPFHYGRWVDRLGYGWCWVPGSVWGPGWVSWRQGGGYAGWAPWPPRGVTVGAPHGVRSPWRFMLAHELGQKRPFLPTRVVPSIFAKTSVVTNLRTASAGGMPVRFNAGPSPAMIHTQVAQVPLRNFAMRALPRPMITPRAGIPAAGASVGAPAGAGRAARLDAAQWTGAAAGDRARPPFDWNRHGDDAPADGSQPPPDICVAVFVASAQRLVDGGAAGAADGLRPARLLGAGVSLRAADESLLGARLSLRRAGEPLFGARLLGAVGALLRAGRALLRAVGRTELRRWRWWRSAPLTPTLISAYLPPVAHRSARPTKLV